MVGNDIVDLGLADRNAWKRKRFLDKVLTPSEQLLMLDSVDPGTFFWVLWSMKESAYKLHFRKNLDRALNPARFRCSFQGDLEGRVKVDDQVYRTASTVSVDYVHTTAIDAKSRAVTKSDEVSAGSFNAVRKKTIESLIRSFSASADLNAEQVKFLKDKNDLPFLTCDVNGMFKACSISHHGRFGAYAIAV